MQADLNLRRTHASLVGIAVLWFSNYHVFRWEEVVDIQQISPPVVSTFIVVETTLFPVWTVVEVPRQAYIKHHKQHIGRSESVKRKKQNLYECFIVMDI